VFLAWTTFLKNMFCVKHNLCEEITFFIVTCIDKQSPSLTRYPHHSPCHKTPAWPDIHTTWPDIHTTYPIIKLQNNMVGCLCGSKRQVHYTINTQLFNIFQTTTLQMLPHLQNKKVDHLTRQYFLFLPFLEL